LLPNGQRPEQIGKNFSDREKRIDTGQCKAPWRFLKRLAWEGLGKPLRNPTETPPAKKLFAPRRPHVHAAVELSIANMKIQ
jgi:hypothetical protein